MEKKSIGSFAGGGNVGRDTVWKCCRGDGVGRVIRGNGTGGGYA